jgi:hypothetical protein
MSDLSQIEVLAATLTLKKILPFIFLMLALYLMVVVQPSLIF